MIRVFFVASLLVSGIVELWAANVFNTPLEQLGVSTIAGAAAVLGARLSQII